MTGVPGKVKEAMQLLLLPSTVAKGYFNLLIKALTPRKSCSVSSVQDFY